MKRPSAALLRVSARRRLRRRAGNIDFVVGYRWSTLGATCCILGEMKDPYNNTLYAVAYEVLPIVPVGFQPLTENVPSYEFSLSPTFRFRPFLCTTFGT